MFRLKSCNAVETAIASDFHPVGGYLLGCTLIANILGDISSFWWLRKAHNAAQGVDTILAKDVHRTLPVKLRDTIEESLSYHSGGRPD